MTEIRGGCLCGAVRYTSLARPSCLTHCHCQSCRKASGAAFVSWFSVPAEDLHWQGSPRFYASSAGVTRGFCPECGTTLSYQRAEDEIDLTLATLDQPEAFPPVDHSFWCEHLPWADPAVLQRLPRKRGPHSG